MNPENQNSRFTFNSSKSNKLNTFLILFAKITKNILFVIVIALVTIILYENLVLKRMSSITATVPTETVATEERTVALRDLSSRTPEISDSEKEISVSSILRHQNTVSEKDRQNSFTLK